VIARAAGRGQASTARAPAVMRFFGRLALAILAIWVALMILWRFLPPVSTLMAARWATLQPVRRIYAPLEAISPLLRIAVLTSEDERFCIHHGVDWGQLFGVLEEAHGGLPSRGASTAPMQTVKNLFLWPSRSPVRKGLEIPLALDAVWPKRRILEVYLNIAQWGDGIFGAEAASRVYFHKHASALTQSEADLLATSLPDPIARNPARPTALQRMLARRLSERTASARALLDCVE
jgi:monofunctional glycosyltransferase